MAKLAYFKSAQGSKWGFLWAASKGSPAKSSCPDLLAALLLKFQHTGRLLRALSALALQRLFGKKWGKIQKIDKIKKVKKLTIRSPLADQADDGAPRRRAALARAERRAGWVGFGVREPA
jgi:hypothetical protein